MSVTDFTGVFNRHLFDERFRKSNALVRYRLPLAIIFCDIDYGTSMIVMDTRSVTARQVSVLLAAGLRGDIWMVRFGGEEFVMVLPETTQDGAGHGRTSAKVLDAGRGRRGRADRCDGSFGVAALQTVTGLTRC